MLGHGSRRLCVGLVCFCIVQLYAGETTVSDGMDQCNTTVMKLYRSVTFSVKDKVRCGWWNWGRCTQYRKRSRMEETSKIVSVGLCFNNTRTSSTNTFPANESDPNTTSWVSGNQSGTSGMSDTVGVPGAEVYAPVGVLCLLLLVTIVGVGVICYRRKQKNRDKKNTETATAVPLDLYVEPEVIRARKRAEVCQNGKSGDFDQSPSGIDEYELTNRSSPVTLETKHCDQNEIETAYEIMDDVKTPVKTVSDVKVYVNQSFQSPDNYDHVTLETQHETSTDSPYANEAVTSEYDHIVRTVHIT